MKYLVPVLSAAVIAACLAMSAIGQTPPAAAPATAPADSKSPIADHTPVMLANGFGFTEGATCNKDGDVYFVDQNNNRIHIWTFDKDLANTDPLKGKLSTFMDPSNRANGMCFDPDGNLIVCADEKNELWSVTMDKKVTVLIKDYKDKPMNGPNDVWVVPTGPLKGAMFITDPFYQRQWWTDRPGGRGMQQPGKYVYFFSADHKTLTPVVTDLVTPNGIIGTPDAKTLYVGDYDGNKTYSYTIKDDGTLADKKLFCNAGSDGMTIDSDGNIYTTKGSDGLQIWDKDGKRVDAIRGGCANVCFGGKDRNILFVCTTNAVYGVKMKTHGVGPQ